MIQSQSLPTIFAISLAKSVDLMHDWDPHGDRNMDDHMAEENRLIAFQQMAIGCEFEDAIIAYHGIELSEEQKVVLAVIYKSTVPWLIGHVVGKLMDDPDNKGKAAELILTELLKDGKVNPEVAKELIVKLQVVESSKPIKGKKNE